MLRRIVLTLAIVLLVSTGAFADIIQLQDYLVGASNGIELLHGHQTGDGSHTICINNDQTAEKICSTRLELRVVIAPSCKLDKSSMPSVPRLRLSATVSSQ
jgi:hypothetical protein